MRHTSRIPRKLIAGCIAATTYVINEILNIVTQINLATLICVRVCKLVLLIIVLNSDLHYINYY